MLYKAQSIQETKKIKRDSLPVIFEVSFYSIKLLSYPFTFDDEEVDFLFVNLYQDLTKQGKLMLK
jgi:hypothetical protein